MTRSLRRNNIGFAMPVLALSLWFGVALHHGCAAALPQPPPAAGRGQGEGETPVPEWPTVPGAILALRNANATTPFVAFDTQGRELLVFNCAPRGRGLFGRFHELVCDGGSFLARDAGAWLGLQVAKSGAFTLEVTLTPAEAAPQTRGVVLSYSDDQGEDVALIQDQTGLSLQLRGAQPLGLFTPEAGKPVHVLFSCDKEKWAAYRDGQPVRSGALAAAAPVWGTRQLFLGAASSGAALWRGRMEGIAVFPRVLAAAEAAAEAASIKASLAVRKPAATVRFRGTLLRQAQTAALSEIRPYTRSLTAAEYKVEQVLAGEWKKPAITVMHWMIMDSKRLPIADRKLGTAVELSVESFDEQPQLAFCRRDDMEGDIVPDLFYCESETAPLRPAIP